MSILKGVCKSLKKIKTSLQIKTPKKKLKHTIKRSTRISNKLDPLCPFRQNKGWVERENGKNEGMMKREKEMMKEIEKMDIKMYIWLVENPNLIKMKLISW